MKLKNIYLAYILSFLKNSWFWLGIWIFYYLRYTDYAGIGLLETIMIVTSTVAEVPSGAIADLMGKRTTLILAFLLQSIGNIWMGLALNFLNLGMAIFLACVGGALCSGTMEALVYDSLKDQDEEKFYDKVIANINSLQLVAMTAASAIGGFMYVFSPQLPFFAVGAACALGFILAFFLKEPSVDTEKFSLKNYLKQTKQGFRQLFKTINIKKQTFLLLSIAVFLVVADEMVDSILAVEFGFTEKQLGIFVAITCLLAAGLSQFAPKLRKLFGETKGIFLIGLLCGFSFVFSPFLGIIIGGLSIILRYSLRTVFYNFSSVIINRATESRYRATTLSTFNMIQNIPYVLSAYFLGSLMDIFSAKTITSVMGVILLILVTVQIFSAKNYDTKTSTAK